MRILGYILSQKENTVDKRHNVRLMFGNGLRAQIWPEFQRRFGVKQIGEFYGATEGNASLINMDNVVGAVGFISRLFPFIYPVETHPHPSGNWRPHTQQSRSLCRMQTR